jgi:hypothetical protein
LRFFLKSFCFFLNRIARYAQSKELEIFLRKFRKSPAKQFLEIAITKKEVLANSIKCKNFFVYLVCHDVGCVRGKNDWMRLGLGYIIVISP